MTHQRSLRVLHCIGDLGIGGAERQLLETVRHSDRQRFSHCLYYFHPPEDLKPEFEQLGVSTIRLSATKKTGWVRPVAGLIKAIRENEIDVVHASVFPADVFAVLAGMLARVPTVITITNTFDTQSRFRANDGSRLAVCKSQAMHRSGYLVASLAGRIGGCRYIAISEAVKRSATKDLKLPLRHTEVVYRGLIPERFARSDGAIDAAHNVKERLGLEDRYPVLLNAARLVPQKGQDDLIRAMPRVLGQYPKACLLIAGEGSRREDLHRLIDQLGLQQHVRLIGEQDVVPLLHACDVFLFASHYEGLGNAVVEAQAAEKPVVAFKIPAVDEVVEDGRSGILVSPRDVDTFAQAVVRLVGDNDLMKSMGERGMEITREKFDIRRNVGRIEQLYARVSRAGG